MAPFIRPPPSSSSWSAYDYSKTETPNDPSPSQFFPSVPHAMGTKRRNAVGHWPRRHPRGECPGLTRAPSRWSIPPTKRPPPPVYDQFPVQCQTTAMFGGDASADSRWRKLCIRTSERDDTRTCLNTSEHGRRQPLRYDRCTLRCTASGGRWATTAVMSLQWKRPCLSWGRCVVRDAKRLRRNLSSHRWLWSLWRRAVWCPGFGKLHSSSTVDGPVFVYSWSDCERGRAYYGRDELAGVGLVSTNAWTSMGLWFVGDLKLQQYLGDCCAIDWHETLAARRLYWDRGLRSEVTVIQSYRAIRDEWRR